MFLKSLYISGFKSFAYPTTIDFSEDVSAIVGPNGSGKSNISDAIRFVLGEQRTKQMRSQSMEDIIFSGTDAQSPRGLAEVKLVLEDDDNSDLVIERRYYRTGESDYLLNGKKVRLKDIHSRFADTGLGKNGYSIISQGGVENIIGASPKELRELVEEAVGIAGYKVRKNETVKRLNTIESNIERVLDVLTEMQKQLKPLKRQAKKAREYLEITNILRDIDLVSFYQKEVEFKTRLEKLNKDLVASNFTVMDLDKEAERVDKEYLETKANLTNVREQIENLTNDITSIKDNIAGFEKESSIKSNDLKNYKENVIRLETEIENFDSNFKSIDSKVSKLESSRREILKEFRSSTKTLENLTNNLKTKENQKSELESGKTESKLNEINNKVNSLVLEEVKLKTEIESLENSEEEVLKRKNKIIQELNGLKEKKFKTEEKYKTFNENSEHFRSQYNKAKEQLSVIDNKERELTAEILNVRNKIEYQKQIRDSYEGFNFSVRAVMAYSKEKSLNGVYGPVGDLFTTKPEYQTAIQVALGAAVQNVVVENSKVAQELIEFLKRENKGRVTFLPLDNINVSKTGPAYVSNGLINKATNLIEYDTKFSKVFERLLDRTLIFKDYISAREYRRENKRNTLVTLEGECFYPSGAIVGGSLKRNFNQLLSPNQELNNLKKQEQNLTQAYEKLKIQKKNITSLIDNSASKVESILKEGSDLKNELTALDQRIKILTNEAQNFSQNNELINKKESLKNITKQQEKLNKIKVELEENLDLKKLDVLRLTDELAELNSKIVEERINFNKRENSLNNIEERLTELKSSREEEYQKYNKKLDELDRLVIASKDNKERVAELNDLIKNLQEKLVKKKETLENCRETLNDLEQVQSEIEQKVKNINDTRIKEVEVKIGIEGQIERLTLEETTLASKISDQYNETFESVSEQIEELKKNKLDLDEGEINKYKKRLKNLGTVNPNSIEDYHELKTRYNSLNENYQDLIEAKCDVEETIDQLSQSMSNQFSEKFGLLNEYFNKSFQTLFEGGKANLNLTNNENVLESGIELFAQPPGKKLKHINLLSGGEKAMTSIALLFAFIQLNPSPFIIIDEIDAALDESNINRFTKYLKKIQEQNQFIIITHRKSTLSECNNIHGVSMASDGISRLCSIKLSDYIGE